MSAPAGARLGLSALYLKAIGLWFGFAAIASLVVAVRDAVMTPVLGEHRAHQLSTLLTCGSMLAAIVIFVRLLGLSRGLTVRIGLLWLALSIWFEFPFGHYILDISWDRLLADYDLREGRLNVLVWLTELLGPIGAASRVRRS